MMSPISFDLNFDVEYGTPVEVAPGLRRVVAQNPNRFTFRGTGTYILGTDELAVIDPGPDIDDHLDSILLAVGEATVSHILITHTHRDHSPLSVKLAEATGAVTYGYGPHGQVPPSDPDDEIDFGPVETPEDHPGPQDKSQSDHADGGYDADFVPDVDLRNGDVIVGDGWTIDCVHTPGHTSNHMCFAWREARALFSGDHVMGWSTSVISPPDGEMGTYMASLEALLDRKDQTYWPTHGNPITNPHEHVRGFMAHRLARERSIVEHVGAGLTSIESLVRTMYADVDPRLYPAAARSVHAHLLHLTEQRVVIASSREARLTDTYTLHNTQN